MMRSPFIQIIHLKTKRPTRGCSRPGLRPGVKASVAFLEPLYTWNQYGLRRPGG